MTVSAAQVQADLASLLPSLTDTWTVTPGTPWTVSYDGSPPHTGEVDPDTGVITYVSIASGLRVVVEGCVYDNTPNPSHGSHSAALKAAKAAGGREVGRVTVGPGATRSDVLMTGPNTCTRYTVT